MIIKNKENKQKYFIKKIIKKYYKEAEEIKNKYKKGMLHADRDEKGTNGFWDLSNKIIKNHYEEFKKRKFNISNYDELQDDIYFSLKEEYIPNEKKYREEYNINYNL